MSSIPRDRVFFHYNYMKSAIGDAQSATSGGECCTIRICDEPRTRLPNTQVASSQSELLNMVGRSGLGRSFSGTFYIEHSTHQTAGVGVTAWDYKKKEAISGPTPVGTRAVPSQVRVLTPGSPPPGRPTRLQTNAPAEARSIQDMLINAGYSRASFAMG
jgi:hypothetical protein